MCIENQIAAHVNNVAKQCSECGEDLTQDDIDYNYYVCDSSFCDYTVDTSEEI